MLVIIGSRFEARFSAIGIDITRGRDVKDVQDRSRSRGLDLLSYVSSASGSGRTLMKQKTCVSTRGVAFAAPGLRDHRGRGSEYHN